MPKRVARRWVQGERPGLARPKGGVVALAALAALAAPKPTDGAGQARTGPDGARRRAGWVLHSLYCKRVKVQSEGRARAERVQSSVHRPQCRVAGLNTGHPLHPTPNKSFNIDPSAAGATHHSAHLARPCSGWRRRAARWLTAASPDTIHPQTSLPACPWPFAACGWHIHPPWLAWA